MKLEVAIYCLESLCQQSSKSVSNVGQFEGVEFLFWCSAHGSAVLTTQIGLATQNYIVEADFRCTVQTEQKRQYSNNWHKLVKF